MANKTQTKPLLVIPAASGVDNAEPLGGAEIRMQIPFLLTADRGEGHEATPNQGNVFFRSVGSTAWEVLSPGTFFPYPPNTPPGWQGADQLEVYSTVQGDGIRVIFNQSQHHDGA